MIIDKQKAATFLLWIEVLMLPGCKCGSSSDSDISNFQANFFPANNPGSGSIYLSELKSERGSLTLGVNAKDVGEINTVYFDLVYNPSVINYSGSEEGDFFKSGGQSTSGFQVSLQNKTEGRIYVAINVLNNSPVKGSGLIGKITFIPIAEENFAVIFENNKLLRYNSSSLESFEITGDWFGGGIISKRI
ncbi:MAG: cohesin domain-containing protein [bacterium]